ncbi:hypothetical protein ACFRJ9_13805 [Paenarthrobacter sp. NPDC056912]|uniref:hypothetical protein n=1 Tax=Paenarthrobacter sp. NPDC056912 TaxID=3345965 RepID=UPI00367111D3
MNSLHGMLAMPAAISLTDSADIHLLMMVGLVLLTGVAALGNIILLLLLAPLLRLAFGRNTPPRN